MAAVRPAGPEPTMTTFASTRSPALRIVDGPPVEVAGAGASSSRAMLKPPNGLGVPPALGSFCVMTWIVPWNRYSRGVCSERSHMGQDVAADEVQLRRIVQVG